MAQVKAQEIGENVAARIRSAVKGEVSAQLKPVTGTMMDLIDRVLDLEKARESSDSPSGHEGEETPEVPSDPQVVQGSGSEGEDPPGTDEAKDIGHW